MHSIHGDWNRSTQDMYAENLTQVFTLANQALYQIITFPDHTLASSHWKSMIKTCTYIFLFPLLFNIFMQVLQIRCLISSLSNTARVVINFCISRLNSESLEAKLPLRVMLQLLETVSLSFCAICLLLRVFSQSDPLTSPAQPCLSTSYPDLVVTMSSIFVTSWYCNFHW